MGKIANVTHIYAALLSIFVCIFGLPHSGFSLEKPGEELVQVGIQPVLGNRVSPDLEFSDQDGTTKPLSQFLASDRPTIIIPVYFKCPRLCGFLMSGFIELVAELTLKLGDDYRVLTVSFDPREGIAEAKSAATTYYQMLEEKNPALKSADFTSGWRFLVGNTENVKKLMDELGFRYLPDGEDFAHSAGLFILTPDRYISQYFTGIQFTPFDARLALVESSQGKIGTPLDHVMLFCFRFDPLLGKYRWVVSGALRIGGLLTLVGLGGLIVLLLRKERVAKAAMSQTTRSLNVGEEIVRR